MTIQSVPLWSEIVGVVSGALVLLIFGIFLVLPHRTGLLPGSKGHRNEDEANETIAPDGYIDSFANVIEEAGGGLPMLVKIAFPGIIIWWLAYLITNFVSK